jgi:hypothetical protein
MARAEYRGFSYQQASREAEKLLSEAIKTGRWFDLPERLIELRAIMNRTDAKQERMKFR